MDRLLATGAVTKEMLYCPSGPVELNDDFWTFGVTGMGHDFRVLTYVLLSDGVAGIPFQYTIRQLGDQTVPVPGHPGETMIVPESQSVLAVDVVMSMGGTVESDFIGIYGWLTEPLLRTSHVNGARPAGGNILYLDGNVVWREFAEMQVRSPIRPGWWW